MYSMRINCTWQSGVKFMGWAGDHQVMMDAKKPVGSDSAMTPKDLLVSALCGCTGMDIAGLMKKHKQPVDQLDIVADVSSTEGIYPAVFTGIELNIKVTGQVDPKVLVDSVALSQNKYCGVSAMLSAAVPITYRIELNGQEIGNGRADFGQRRYQSSTSLPV